MTEIRAAVLPVLAPIRLEHIAVSFADVSLRPLLRVVAFAAALSLPILATTIADRSPGDGGSRMVRARAVLPLSLSGGAAPRSLDTPASPLP